MVLQEPGASSETEGIRCTRASSHRQTIAARVALQPTELRITSRGVEYRRADLQRLLEHLTLVKVTYLYPPFEEQHTLP